MQYSLAVYVLASLRMLNPQVHSFFDGIMGRVAQNSRPLEAIACCVTANSGRSESDSSSAKIKTTATAQSVGHEALKVHMTACTHIFNVCI